MNLLSLFQKKGNAPVARERLQVLLAYERQTGRGQPDLVNVLRDEILALIARHVQVERDDVMVKMERGSTSSTLEIDVQIPNGGLIKA